MTKSIAEWAGIIFIGLIIMAVFIFIGYLIYQQKEKINSLDTDHFERLVEVMKEEKLIKKKKKFPISNSNPYKSESFEKIKIPKVNPHFSTSKFNNNYRDVITALNQLCPNQN